MRRSNFFVRVVPFALLLCCAFEIFICDIKYYEEIQLILSQIFGFGIITVSKDFYLSVKYRACLYTPVALIGLALLNVINIAFLYFKLHYTITIEDESILKVALDRNDQIGTFYDSIVVVIFIISTGIFFIKEEIFWKTK